MTGWEKCPGRFTWGERRKKANGDLFYDFKHSAAWKGATFREKEKCAFRHSDLYRGQPDIREGLLGASEAPGSGRKLPELGPMKMTEKEPAVWKVSKVPALPFSAILLFPFT